MASEPAKCGKQRPEPARRERKGFLFICSSLAAMLCDLERVRAALRAGAQPQQVHGINALTREAAGQNSTRPGQGCAHSRPLGARNHVRPHVGRGKGRARQEQEPVRSKRRKRCRSKQQRLNGPLLPLRRGTATRPCAQVVLALPSGIPARTRRNGYECLGRATRRHAPRESAHSNGQPFAIFWKSR